MIPEKLKIFGHDYVVMMHDQDEVGNYHLGTHIHRSTEILINRSQSKTQMESTLIHEIIEALNVYQELNLKHDQVVRLETGLYQVLKDNKLDFS